MNHSNQDGQEVEVLQETFEVCLDTNPVFSIRCDFLPTFDTLLDAANVATKITIASGVKHSVWRKSDRKRVFQAIPEIRN